ncbi:MAG TPA: hypothetical protein VKV73_05190 [Chloroflexota bacterium]|nr:hypothetical protein [Chloroflexota bacterium]
MGRRRGGPLAVEPDLLYGHVKHDPILAPVLAEMSAEHPEWVAQWLGEVFGGPPRYTNERGGYPHMIGRHLGRAIAACVRACGAARRGRRAAVPA